LPDQSGGYTVRGVYDMLTAQEQPLIQQNMELIWHKQVPLKVSIFSWRLLRDRLPTRQNLANRGILAMDSRFCLAGCDQVEDVNHLFLSCPVFGALWPLVRDWLGVEGAESQVISDHFLQFIHYEGVLKSRRSFFHLIWLMCVWVLCLASDHSSIQHMLDKVKSYSLWWLKASNVAFRFGTHHWWSNPLVCLGIG
jgi:hypothetical protein